MKKKIVLALSLALVLVLGVMSVFALHTGAQAATPVLSVDYANLSFRDSITVKYAVKAENATDVKLLCWTEANGTYEKGSEARVLKSSYTEMIGGSEYLVFDYTGLAAKQMTDVIYVRAYTEVGGAAYYSNVLKYSVLEYAYTMLGKIGNAASSDAKLKTLLENMLTYGASAQTYLNYRTDALANASFYQVKVKDGLLSDGTASGLFREGAQVTVTAASEKDGVPFSHWADASGAKVADTATATITVGGANAVLSPVYKQALTYSEGLEFDSNGDGTCYVVGMGDCTDTELVIPPVSPEGDTVVGVEGFAGEDITSVSFPSTIQEIARRAFNNCSSLTDVYFDGTEEEWNEISIASGNDAIENATMHFNAPEVEIFTVTFVDYDGAVLKTEDVESGKSATAPTNPTRNGYTFIGWDKSYDSITASITITAQYEIVENQTCINYTHNGDGTTTAKFSINGDVNIAMIELQLKFDLTNATYKEYEILVSGSADANYADGIFYFSFMSANDITTDTDLFSITFTNGSGNVGISFTVIDSSVSDGTFTNITAVTIVGTTYNS